MSLPLPFKGCSASHWASTEDGRKAFRRPFKVTRFFKLRQDLLNDEPKDYVLYKHLPSLKWLDAKKVELMTRLADPASYTSSGLEEGLILRQTIPVLSQYLVDAAKQIQKLAEPAKITLPYIAADQKRHIGFDNILSANFEKLVAICADIRTLRSEIPPSSEPAWAPLINQIISIGTKPFESLFDNNYKEKPRLAMPRAFARSREEVFVDSWGFSGFFQPDRCLYLPRDVNNFDKLTERQQRCFVGLKKVSSTSQPAFPVLSMELKKRIEDLPEAEGKAMYSAVQAAGIYANCNSPLQTLILTVGYGFVQPWTSSWDGDSVCFVHGKSLDLGELQDIITLVLIIRCSVMRHLQDAFDVSINELDLGAWSLEELTPVRLSAGPPIDWRAKFVAEKSAKKRQSSGVPLPGSAPRKKSKSADAAAAGNGAGGDDDAGAGDAGDPEDDYV